MLYCSKHKIWLHGSFPRQAHMAPVGLSPVTALCSLLTRWRILFNRKDPLPPVYGHWFKEDTHYIQVEKNCNVKATFWNDMQFFLDWITHGVVNWLLMYSLLKGFLWIDLEKTFIWTKIHQPKDMDWGEGKVLIQWYSYWERLCAHIIL